MKTGKRALLVLFTLLLCVACDQVTKELAKSHLPKNKVLSLAAGVVRLDLTENRGAVLSFEHCLPRPMRGPVLSVTVALLLGLAMGYLLFSAAPRPLPVTALSLICGGTLSNLLDRVVFGGSVIDFLSIGWGGFRTAIFNLADVAIVTGTVLLGLSLIRTLISVVSRGIR